MAQGEPAMSVETKEQLFALVRGHGPRGVSTSSAFSTRRSISSRTPRESTRMRFSRTPP
jgi:hypothetical protein